MASEYTERIKKRCAENDGKTKKTGRSRKGKKRPGLSQPSPSWEIKMTDICSTFSPISLMLRGAKDRSKEKGEGIESVYDVQQHFLRGRAHPNAAASNPTPNFPEWKCRAGTSALLSSSPPISLTKVLKYVAAKQTSTAGPRADVLRE